MPYQTRFRKENEVLKRVYLIFEVDGIIAVNYKRCLWIPDNDVCILSKLK
jgi:hypothetical protein